MVMTELLERLRAATSELSDADAVELWAMGAGCKIVAVKNWSRDDSGYRVVSLLVDDRGSRKTVHVPEWQFPDRSIDTALGLVTRLLPGWHVEIYGASSQTAAVKIEPPLRKDGEAAWSPNNRPPPIAILTALVSALSQPGVQS